MDEITFFLKSKLTYDLIEKIIKIINLENEKDNNKINCVMCKGPVTHWEYIDGVGYFCNICSFGL